MALHLFHPFRRHQQQEPQDMPTYVVHSDSPITSRPVNRPDLPDWEIGQLPEMPSRPGMPTPPEGWEKPTIPPREEWPPLPPWFQPGVGLPIPPTVEHPWVPVPPDPEVDPPEIWPPLPMPPTLPDMSGKTLVLALLFISRHVSEYRWIVIDHEEAKTKLEKALAWIKGKLPAGGIPGRPPQRPTPG